MSKYMLPQFNWYVDRDVEISLPDDWEVEYHTIPGDSWPVLSDDLIRQSLQQPLGSPSLKDMARGKESVIIVVDDISRPTPAHKIVPFLLEELHEGGIKDDQIEFLVALGAHGAHTRIEMAKKLGDDIVRNYPVYNHNCYENTVDVGKMANGTRVLLNAEYMKCDLRIGIGSVLPHPFNGLSGTGKIITPGICHIDSIMGTHLGAAQAAFNKGLNPIRGLGNWQESQMREDVEKIAEMAGPDFLVQCLVGSRRQLIGLSAGHPVQSYRALIDKSLQAYGTDCAHDMDVVIANAGVKGCEATIAMNFGIMSLKETGGDVVLVCHSPMGQIPHYVFGKFGRSTYGRFSGTQGKPLPPHLNRLIVYTPYPAYTDAEWFARQDQVIWATSWEEVMDLLGNHGAGTKTAVYQDGTIMYFTE